MSDGGGYLQPFTVYSNFYLSWVRGAQLATPVLQNPHWRYCCFSNSSSPVMADDSDAVERFNSRPSGNPLAL